MPSSSSSLIILLLIKQRIGRTVRKCPLLNALMKSRRKKKGRMSWEVPKKVEEGKKEEGRKEEEEVRKEEEEGRKEEEEGRKEEGRKEEGRKEEEEGRKEEEDERAEENDEKGSHSSAEDEEEGQCIDMDGSPARHGFFASPPRRPFRSPLSNNSSLSFFQQSPRFSLSNASGISEFIERLY